MRRVASTVLLVVAGLMLPVAILANWAQGNLYESDSFSARAVEPLNSEAVRKELAHRLTDQLVQAGNQQATSFRPAFELALQGVIDTDTFKSIFRNAVRETHEAVLEGGSGRQGLDLGASFALITSSLQTSGGGGGGQQGAQGLDNSLSDVTSKIDDFGLWDAEGTIGQVSAASFLIGLAAVVGSILLAVDRRRAVRRLGIAAVIGGLFVVALVYASIWVIGQQISDGELADAIKGALTEITSDLRLIGLWIAAYGLIVAAAAASSERRYTPAEVWRRARGWVDRRRQTTWGTILLGVLGILVSIVFIQEPLGNFELLIRAAALWVGYLAVTELLRLVRAITAKHAERRALWPRIATIGGAVVVVAGLVTTGFLLTTRGAAKAAQGTDEQVCNSRKSLCDLRVDQVTFPGVHHAMASAEYPGWLFAQQIGTITQQLNAGVRALNIDTHYGVRSTARIPGQSTPIVLTDRTAEKISHADDEDPVAAKRAAQLAAGAPKAAEAQRGIYMCHSNCETGAVEFSKGLEEIRRFLVSHPDDVLILTLHDFTSPADNAAAIEAAGLADHAATLQPGQPLPTLRELIDNGQNLLVFAERGDPGGPPWYHSMYDWFQETSFSYANKNQFNCQPNRGRPDAPLFLINHWITVSPPDPPQEALVNSRAVLDKRIQDCLRERGLAPNILQVQFAERGDLMPEVQTLNDNQLKEERAKAAEVQATTPPPPGETAAPGAPDVGALAPLPEATVIATLTGGDPVALCREIPSATFSVTGWAVAALQGDPAAAGRSDLAYAPLLARELRSYVRVAPQELQAKAQPILDRANDAVASLRALGLEDRAIKRLAGATSDALLGPDKPDGATVRDQVLKQLEKRIDPAQLNQAANDFLASHGDPTPLMDLGNVPQDVAIAAGLPCANEPRSR